MKDESLLLPDGLIGDAPNDWTGGPADAAPPRRAAPPGTCEEVLVRLGAVKKAVYAFVRDGVDELEQAAPWDLLYYPPEDPDALLAMIGGLVVAIRGVPDRVDRLVREIPPGGEPGSDGPTQEDIGFLFGGIHRMVARDLKRLEASLETMRNRGPAAPPTPADGQVLCELAADLKGKYASSLMGAAASLIGEGSWDGVELEPVLFPEKAEEFRCTRELVVALREAVAAIRHLPEQIPFAELLERWRQRRRVDQYALADLPSLRGKIGRLLKARSRRALYSGDYHQISRREVLLSARINELEQLHQQTWLAPGPGSTPDLAPVFARLVQLTLEAAAVLDADILKGMIGEKKVNGLRGKAVSATAAGRKPQPKEAVPGAAPDLDALVPLLAEDDLRIFFEMLLASVQRRASLAVREPAEPAPAPSLAAPAAPPRPLPASTPAKSPKPPVASVPPPRRSSPSPPPAPPPIAQVAPPVPSPPPAAPRLPAEAPEKVMARIQAVLVDLQAPTSAHWSSFRMTQRLLEKHSRIPVAMFHAVNPFLQDILWRLIPDLKKIAPYKGLTAEAVARLEVVCRELCEGDPDPASFADEVPRKLERILRFLDGLRALAQPEG